MKISVSRTINSAQWADTNGDIHRGELQVRGVILRCSKCLVDFDSLRGLWIHDEYCDVLNWSMDRVRRFRYRTFQILMGQFLISPFLPITFARYEQWSRAVHELGLQECL